MKRPKAYNYGRLVQTPENLKAYAKYFVKYIQAYAEHGITVNQLHVQNEVFADQKFPSALWDSEALKVFIRDYLGPAFDEAGLSTDIWLGTLNHIIFRITANLMRCCVAGRLPMVIGYRSPQANAFLLLRCLCLFALCSAVAVPCGGGEQDAFCAFP